MSGENTAKISNVAHDFEIDALDDPVWSNAETVLIDRYWSGESAPAYRQFETRLLWSETSLYVRFDSRQGESLIVSETPDLIKKAMGLWDRDVCEIFLAPDPTAATKYYEFEIAPTGEWLDVAVEVLPDRRVSDWGYHSGIKTVARLENDRIISAMRIGWDAFGCKPKIGDVWLGNLFRCVGKDPDRGYLTWQPTYTSVPSFHVPERFGRFKFAD
jgi:hypothetical protein